MHGMWGCSLPGLGVEQTERAAQVRSGGKIASGHQRAGVAAACKLWRVVLKDEVVEGNRS